ncbi:lytic transglycosylase domain-containing protein [Rouxiella sp. WC2420]|uniref:Lytic transglycosylase domain-containing protein n=1 Tax=Rouxiella sp. WC2420 TaxID=3234145 RepID=A0AB39VNI4_9GAMM
MANIIDALIITLGIDASSFNSGQKKVSEDLKKTGKDADKTAKDMEAAGKRAASFFGSIRTEVLALAGVTLTLGGLKNLVTGTANSLQQLSIQSKALDMSGKELDGWSKSAIAAGSSAESITSALMAMQKTMQSARNGDWSGPLINSLGQLNSMTGIKFDVLHETPDQIMRKVMEALRKLPSDKARVYAQQFGIDDAILQRDRAGTGKGEFVGNVDKFTASSGYTDSGAEAARKFNVQWTIVQQNLEKTRDLLFAALIPYIDQFNNALIQFSNWINTHPKEIHDAIKQIGDAFSEVVKFANQGADSVGGWKTAIEILVGAAVGGKLLSLFTGLSSSLLGPAGLIAALLALQALVVKPYEDAHPELKNNPVAKTLNDLPGTDSVGAAGEDFRSWLQRHTGIQLPTADSGSFEAVMQQAKDFFSGDWAARNATDPDLSDTPPTVGSGKFPAWLIPHAGNDGLFPSGGLAGSGEVPQRAQSSKVSGAGSSLLQWMSSQFGALEAKYSLPTGLLNSVATTESGGNQFAVSGAGAKGLFQFMDGTAKDMGLQGNDVFDPKKSAEAAAKYLAQLLKATHGNLNEALAAYNWGLGNVQRKGLDNAPEETRNYVPKVLSGLRFLNRPKDDAERAPKVLAGVTTGAAAAANYHSNHTYTTSSESSSQYISINRVDVQSNAKTVPELATDLRGAVNRQTIVLTKTTGQG